MVIDWEVEYNENLTITEKYDIVSECEGHILYLESFGEDPIAVEEKERLIEIISLYSNDLNDWEVRVVQYPVACTIWQYLIEEMELSEIAAAGILGNMMVESGGYTLSINTSAYSSGFYGICQWSTS